MTIKQILVVDDDERILYLLKLIIEYILPDHQVVLVKDGRAALAEFYQQPFALILTDYDMPEMNGLDLTLAIKQIAPDSRIVLMTSANYYEIESKPGVSHLSGFLAKPFSMLQLKETLHGAGIS